MKIKLKKTMAVALGLGILGTALPKQALFAQDAAPTEETKKEAETKLLKLRSLEVSFLRANQLRNKLSQLVVLQTKALRKKDLDKEQAKKIRTALKTNQDQLKTISVAMEVVFGIGNRRAYDFDPVKSTIFLKVGTVQSTFAKAYKTREILRNAYAKRKVAKEEAGKTEEEIATLDKEMKIINNRYQTVAAAMQIIFNVTPQRNYTYNPKNSTLYLKITDTELAKLKTDIEKIKQDRIDAAEKK